MKVIRISRSAAFHATSLAILVLGGCVALARSGDMVVRTPALDSEIVLRTCSEFAGAVCSISFRGKEHIDRKDHGRLLQSASSFDRYGECYNPTEGGAARDAGSSTSELRAARVEGNGIRTLVDMAFWLRPGDRYPRGCGARKDVTRTVNTASLSGHLLEKAVMEEFVPSQRKGK